MKLSLGLGTTSVAIQNQHLRNPLTAAINAAFGNGEEGAIFLPVKLDAHYQDEAGTTPVTAVEQPAGLALDVRRYTERGAEQRANGVTDKVGTAADATYDTSTGVGSCTRTDFSNQSFVEIPVSATGSFHEIDIEHTGGDAPLLWVRKETRTGNINDVIAGERKKLILGSASQYVITSSAGTSEFTVHSVREIPGNHATQPDSAKRPTLDGDPIAMTHDGVDDLLNVTLPDLGTDATVSYATVADGITHLTNQTISGSYDLPQEDWVGMVVYEGPYTTEQQDAIEALLQAALDGKL